MFASYNSSLLFGQNDMIISSSVTRIARAKQKYLHKLLKLLSDFRKLKIYKTLTRYLLPINIDGADQVYPLNE